jgi:chromosome segregation ATPase
MDTEKSGFGTRVKEFFSKTGSRMKLSRLTKSGSFKPDVNENGLLSDSTESKKVEPLRPNAVSTDKPANIAKSAQDSAKNEQLEKLQDGFNRLIGQLENINNNLTHQVDHQQQLIERLDKLPQMFESFAPSIKSQQQLTEQMITEIKASAVKNQKFIDAVESIPTETAKQTDALQSIDHQLAAAADCDAQMTQSFSKFRVALDKLDQSTVGQTDSILQMSKTFAASDRYLKYIISRDKKRMFWLLIVSLGICFTVILAMVGIILYLGR